VPGFIGKVVNRHCTPEKGTHGLDTRAGLRHGPPEPSMSFVSVLVDRCRSQASDARVEGVEDVGNGVVAG
jgi:hypothetical protein